MPGGTLLLAAMAATFSLQLKPEIQIDLQDRAIRVQDVVNLDPISRSERAMLGTRIIARLPQDDISISLKRSAVASLVRRRVPMLQVEGEPGDITFRTRAAAPPPERRCIALVRPIRAGQVLSREGLAAESCQPPESSLVRWDQRVRSLRAKEELNAGPDLGRIVPSDRPTVETGDKLMLVSRAGPVRVTRIVTALQSGRSGQRIFVQDSDGHVEATSLEVQDPGGRQ